MKALATTIRLFRMVIPLKFDIDMTSLSVPLNPDNLTNVRLLVSVRVLEGDVRFEPYVQMKLAGFSQFLAAHPSTADRTCKGLWLGSGQERLR